MLVRVERAWALCLALSALGGIAGNGCGGAPDRPVTEGGLPDHDAGPDSNSDVGDSACACPKLRYRVCGADGTTYDNDCLAACAGTTVSYGGACGATNNTPAPAGAPAPRH